MKLTKAEAINLILGFYTTPTGCWVDGIYDDFPELVQFIDGGLTCIDQEDDRKIIPNQKGKEILFLHFSEISNDYISFMLKKGMNCKASEVYHWFVTKYDLKNVEVAKDISFLVSEKLEQFGYNGISPLRGRDDKFIIQKIWI